MGRSLIPKGGNDRVMTPDPLAQYIVDHFKPDGLKEQIDPEEEIAALSVINEILNNETSKIKINGEKDSGRIVSAWRRNRSIIS